MKKVITILTAVLIAVSVFSQAPQRMSYQSIVRNASGNLITSANIGVRISVLQGSTTGTAVYVETQTITTNDNGLASLEIGGGTPVTGTFAAIDWANGPYFLKTETDPAGGTNYTIAGTSQLLSVPYALYANSSGNSGTGSFTHYTGELFGGGIVVSVWKETGVEHGLIASLADLSPGEVWSNVDQSPVDSTTKSSIDGQANTAAIIAQAGHTTSAALLCDNYSDGGFSDWYLPAIWELNILYQEAVKVNSILEADGNAQTVGFEFFVSGYYALYWSSTEEEAAVAWYQNFFNGITNYDSKTTTYRVRAVRRF